MVKAQQWLNKMFPTQEDKEKVKKLCVRLNKGSDKLNQQNYEFWGVKLEGELDLNGFNNLEEFAIWGNWASQLQPMTNLKINRCSKLQKLYLDCIDISELYLNTNKQITSLIVHGCINLLKINGLEELQNLQDLNLWNVDTSLLNSKLQIPFSKSNWKLELEKIKEIQTLKEKAKRNEQQLKELVEFTDMILPNTTFDLGKLKQEIARLKLNELVPQAQKEKSELEQQITNAKNNVESNLKKVIDSLLEVQKQIIEKNDPLVQAQLTGQLIAYQSILEENLSKQELQALLDKKTEFIQLEKQIDKLQQTMNQKLTK